jgi:hypothetical protein
MWEPGKSTVKRWCDMARARTIFLSKFSILKRNEK